MGIRKRGKTWWIDITAPSGDRVRRSAQTEERREAQEYHDRLKAELWRVDKLKEKQKRTWDEAALRWLDDRKRGSEDTLVGILRWLQPHLRGKVLQDITPSVIEDIMRRKRKEEVSPSTVNKYLTVIRAVLRFAHGLGWMESVPRVRTIPTDDRRIRFLTHAEAARLLKELPEHQRDLAQFALLTGLRQRNILELSWDQIDMDRRLAWIHPEQAKGRKAIGIPLVPEALAILRKNEGNHPERVFTFEGKPIGQVNTKAWRKALKRAGITDFRWHDLRHTWASWHLQQGTPLAVLQELGGWSDYKMVQRYAHLSKDHLSGYAEKISYGTNPSHPKLKIV